MDQLLVFRIRNVSRERKLPTDLWWLPEPELPKDPT
jgi:hypothetical protein